MDSMRSRVPVSIRRLEKTLAAVTNSKGLPQGVFELVRIFLRTAASRSKVVFWGRLVFAHCFLPLLQTFGYVPLGITTRLRAATVPWLKLERFFGGDMRLEPTRWLRPST